MSDLRRLWTCDWKDCNEIAQFYREYKGELLKLCTKHEVQSAKQHLGKHVDNLSQDDIQYLQSKEERSQFLEKVPFTVRFNVLEGNSRLIEIQDRRSNIWRSFKVSDNDFDSEAFFKIYRDMENGNFAYKSIDEFLTALKEVSLKKS